MKTTLIITLIFTMLSCGNNGNTPTDLAYESYADVSEMAPMRQKVAGADVEQVQSVPITKKQIKTGGVNFRSGDVDKDYEKIKALLPRYEAYINDENQFRNSDQVGYNLSIRVPAERFDSLSSEIAGLAETLENRYSNIEDVTERYYDLKTRISNKEALEKRYVELLKDAKDVKDILEIERNLNEIRTEIEQLQGQFNYLSKQVAFSTLQVSFYEVLPYSYSQDNRPGYFTRVINALSDGWYGFLSFLVWTVRMWPFWILAILGIWGIKKFRKTRKNRIKEG